MGKSKSSQSTSNTSTQVDRKITQGEDSIAFSLDQGASFTMSDPGAFDLAGDALQIVSEGGDRMLTAVEKSLENNERLTKEILGRNQSETGQRLEQLIKYGAAVGAIGLVVVAIKKGRG